MLKNERTQDDREETSSLCELRVDNPTWMLNVGGLNEHTNESDDSDDTPSIATLSENTSKLHTY